MCEAEHVAFPTAMRKMISSTQSLNNFAVALEATTATPEFSCKAFEANQSCVAVSESKNSPARTKCIEIKTIILGININCFDSKN